MQPVQDTPLTTAVTQSETKDDRVNDIKTIYNVSGWSIFWRNFLAGMSRALGGIIMYLLFVTIVSYTFMVLVYPHLEPFISSYQSLITNFSAITNPNSKTTPDKPDGSGPNLDQIKNDPLFQQLIQKYQ